MIIRLLLYIKHKITFVWKIIERSNAILFSVFYNSRLEKVLSEVLNEFTLPPYVFRRLKITDAGNLFDLINRQTVTDLKYFRPHGFDPDSIRNLFKNRSFLMMGTFEGEKMTGYFFLRFFINKKCFVGRLIDRDHRGRGIGPMMNNILYETAWRMKFRCFSTISRENTAVIMAHKKNRSMVVLKELKNDYLLVEFVR